MASAEPGTLSPDVEAVVQRWNPDGLKRLQTVRDADPASRRVAVVGPGRVGKSEVVRELGALAPDLEWVPSAMEAAVVLVLLDAAAPLGAEALEVIDRLAMPGSRVVFALNKIDAHRDWQSVLDRNVELLSRQQRFGRVRMLPVSARLANAARVGAGRTDLVWTNSGLPALHDAVVGELDRSADGSWAAHLDGAATTVVEQTRNRVRAAADTLRRADDAAQLRAERSRLVARRDGGRTATMALLRGQVQLARSELVHDLGVRVRALNTRCRADIDRLDRDRLPEYPQQVNTSVAELTDEVDRRAHARLQQVTVRVFGAAASEQPVTWERPTPHGDLEAPEPRHRGVEDRLMIAFGASAGVGLGRLAVAPLTMVPALDIATIPVTLALGGGAAWWLTRSRSQVADRTHLRQWVSESLVNVRSQLEQRVQAAVVEAEAELADRVVRDSSARMVEVDQQIANLDVQLRDLAATRAGRLASCERDLQVIAAVAPA